MDKFSKLSLVRFANDEERKYLAGQISPFLTVQLLKGTSNLEKVELLKVVKADNGEEKVEYWVRSKFLGVEGLLNKNRAETIEKGIESLLKKP